MKICCTPIQKKHSAGNYKMNNYIFNTRWHLVSVRVCCALLLYFGNRFLDFARNTEHSLEWRSVAKCEIHPQLALFMHIIASL